MIGVIADAINRMFAVEKVQAEQSASHINKDHKANIAAFEQNALEQTSKVSEVKDTYESKKAEDDDESNSNNDKKKKKKKKHQDDHAEDDEKPEVKHFDKKV